MARKRRKLPIAAVFYAEDDFGKKSAESRKRLVEEAKKRPLTWRCALMFKAGHQPESWAVGPNGYGWDVHFRVSTAPNTAGYFVGWRSVHEKDGTLAASHYVADKDRAVCRAKTLRKAHRYATKRGNAEAIARLDAVGADDGHG